MDIWSVTYYHKLVLRLLLSFPDSGGTYHHYFHQERRRQPLPWDTHVRNTRHSFKTPKEGDENIPKIESLNFGASGVESTQQYPALMIGLAVDLFECMGWAKVSKKEVEVGEHEMKEGQTIVM